MLGTGASASAVMLSHQVVFVITILLSVGNLLVMYMDRPRGFGPFILTVVATPFIMLNPIVNLMLDNDSIEISSAANTLMNVLT